MSQPKQPKIEICNTFFGKRTKGKLPGIKSYHVDRRHGDHLPGARGSPPQHHVDSSQRGADRHHSWTQTGSSCFLFFWPRTDLSFPFFFLASDRLVHSKCYKCAQIGCFWYHQSPIASKGKKLQFVTPVDEPCVTKINPE